MLSIEIDRVIPHETIAKTIHSYSSSVLIQKIISLNAEPAVIIFSFFLRAFGLFCLPQSIGRISPNEEIATDQSLKGKRNMAQYDNTL